MVSSLDVLPVSCYERNQQQLYIFPPLSHSDSLSNKTNVVDLVKDILAVSDLLLFLALLYIGQKQTSECLEALVHTWYDMMISKSTRIIQNCLD